MYFIDPDGMQAVGNAMFDDESTENQKLGNVKSMSRAASEGSDALSLVNSLLANSGAGVTHWVNNGDGSFSSDGDDIVIKGENDSSITIKTDLIDVSVDAGWIVGDLGGNYTFEGTDILIAALDIVGIVDPTGMADMAAATLEAQQGNWGSALLSGMGIIPYIGDLGKAGKVGKHVKTIKKAISETKVAKGGRSLWTLTKEGASAIKNHKTFGTIYKSNSDGLWWAVDKAGHGGSKFKVFKEGKGGLEWFKDADEFGNFITNKHKGSTGTFIPWGQLGTVK